VVCPTCWREDALDTIKLSVENAGYTFGDDES
jgi:hypothetical protein